MHISIFQYAINKLPERTRIILRHQVEVAKSSKSYMMATTGKPLTEIISDFLKKVYHQDMSIGLICQDIAKLEQEAGLITEGIISTQDVVDKFTALKLSGNLQPRTALKQEPPDLSQWTAARVVADLRRQTLRDQCPLLMSSWLLL